MKQRRFLRQPKIPFPPGWEPQVTRSEDGVYILENWPGEAPRSTSKHPADKMIRRADDK